MIKNVLFISAGFAPWGGPAAMRATKLVKQALLRGIECNVLTTSVRCRHVFDDLGLWDEVQGVETIRVSDGTDYIGRGKLERLLGYHAVRLVDRLLAKRRKKWAQDCVLAAKKEFVINPPNLIYATSPGPEVAWIASELSRSWGVPYIVDFRDPPWEIGMSKEDLKGYLATCELAVFNTPVSATRVQVEYPECADKVECWTNGTEPPPKLLDSTILPPRIDPMTILFPGGVYPWLVDAVRKLRPYIIAGRVRVDVYGFLESKRHKEIRAIKKLGALFHNPVPSKDVPLLLMNAHVCLVVLPQNYQFRVSIKTYQMIASGRPVMIFGEASAARQLFKGLPGIFYFDHSTTDDELNMILCEIARYDPHSGWEERSNWVATRTWSAIFDGIFDRFIQEMVAI